MILQRRFSDVIIRQSDISPTIEAGSGEGGNNLPMILESNQDHATAQETEICPTLPASMGLGGGYVPMVVEQTAYGVVTKGNGEAFLIGEKHMSLSCGWWSSRSRIPVHIKERVMTGVLSESYGSINGEQSSRQLLRSGCV